MPGGAARGLSIAGLVVAAAVVAAMLLGGDASSYRVNAVVQDAGQLVKGNLVKVGGVTVGSVDAIELTSRNHARITLAIEDGDFEPLRRGTRAVVRSTSLSAVAGRQVSLEPGPNDAPAIPDGGTIPAQDTTPIVDLDQVLNTVDAETRSALQEVVHGSARSYAGAEREANRALEVLNPALSQTARTLDELTRDERTLERFLVHAATTAGAVASREDDLERGVTATAGLADAVAGQQEALDEVLRRTPGVLRRANTTLVDWRAALRDIAPVFRDARPVAPRVARLLPSLESLTRRAGPAVRDVRGLLPDLGRTLTEVERLEPVARPLLGETADVVRSSDHIVAAARTYTPDLVAGLMNGFGGTTAGYYDANGHYARIALQGNVLSLSHSGSVLIPAPQEMDDPLYSYRTKLLRRCPGAATQAAADGSNPWAAPEAPCSTGDSPR